jgi:hypothetical protein
VYSGLADRLRAFADVVFAVPGDRDLSEPLTGWPTTTLPSVDQSDRSHAHIKQRLGRAHFWIASPTVARSLLHLYRSRASLPEKLVITLNTWRARWESEPTRYHRLVEEEYRRWNRLNRAQLGFAGQLLDGFDTVIFPAPHSWRERWLSRMAKELGLRTIAIIHSFDNPTTTSRHFVIYDQYLVWNERMRGELRRIYPEIPKDALSVVGTAHFYPYFEPDYRGDKGDFLSFFRLDGSRPVVLYAGGPCSLVPHETSLVARLCEDLRSLPANCRPQLVVRPHPIERNFDRWTPLRKGYPEVRWSIPWAKSAEEAEWAIPSQEEIRRFCMLVRYSDVVVNSCSTMSIDAALCDRPVICLDYTLPPFKFFAPYMHRYYDWDHYRPIIESGGVRLARAPEQLLRYILEYIANPALDRSNRSRLVSDMCGAKPHQAVSRIAEAIRCCPAETAKRPVSAAMVSGAS